VNFGGWSRRLPDYVPRLRSALYHCHVGFALSKIDEETAQKTLADFREMGCLRRSWPARKRRLQGGKDPQSACPDGSSLRLAPRLIK